MSDVDERDGAEGDREREREALAGSGLVRHLASRWEAAHAGTPGALLASGEELPPLAHLPRLARAGAGGGAGRHRSAGAAPQLLEEALQESDPEERVEEWEVVEERGCGNGGSTSCSLVQFVRVRLRQRGPMRLVFKTPRPSPIAAKVFDVEAMAAKEVGLYRHVLPNMAKLWPEGAFDVFPACLSSSSDAIILQDLRAAGFSTPTAPLTADECTAVAEALARFHAASLVYKAAAAGDAGAADEAGAGVAALLAEAGAETLYSQARRQQLQPLLDKAADNTLHLLQRHTTAAKHLGRVKELLSRRYELLAELMRPKEPFAVLTHGDPRPCNVLLRPRQPAGQDAGAGQDACPLEARLVDLRFCRFASVGLDLALLLHGGAAGPDARARSDALLRGYQRALERALRAAPRAPPPPFTLAQLRKEVEEHAIYGLLTADLSLRLQMNLQKEREEAGDSDEGASDERAAEEVFSSNAPGDAFALAYGDLVLQLADRGLL